MENRIRFEAVDDLVEVHVTGKLTREMYGELVPVVERQIRDHGKLRMLLVLHDFHGWTAGALWEDVKFDVKHFGDIRRLAIVGESKWQKGMATFCKPFTTAKVEYFPTAELQAARSWLAEAAAKPAKKG